MVFLTQSTDAIANPAWKYITDTPGNNIWASFGPIKLTHKIGPHIMDGGGITQVVRWDPWVHGDHWLFQE